VTLIYKLDLHRIVMNYRAIFPSKVI